MGNLTLTSCNTTEPPPPDKTKPTLTIELDDVSCIEAWLQLKTKDLDLPAELTLKQYNPTGDSLSHIFVLNTQDSLLYIDSLLPNQNYSFRVTSSQYQVSSIQQPVITMDTTSHNFTFQSWTFGTVGSSVLYDVAIINENNIWAVGEIMIADTSINGYTTYNAVHWDGNQWELKRIPYYFNNQTFYGAIRAIFAFKENDIWFGTGNMIHWNGIDYISVYVGLGMTINKIWGSSNQDVYIVGNNGSIAHYNGSNWQRIESGTTLNINDIWGDFNEKTQKWEVLAVCGNILQ
ncbi:MAG TPA: glucosyl transferase, partial [Ignavibacteriaceae bacterium]|nr:glucosyl transferase [Ignavibacteriaceae bacterium]